MFRRAQWVSELSECSVVCGSVRSLWERTVFGVTCATRQSRWSATRATRDSTACRLCAPSSMFDRVPSPATYTYHFSYRFPTHFSDRTATSVLILFTATQPHSNTATLPLCHTVTHIAALITHHSSLIHFASFLLTLGGSFITVDRG